MIALARPSAVGSGGAGKAAAWLSPEVLAMFLYHYVRPLNEQVRCFPRSRSYEHEHEPHPLDSSHVHRRRRRCC